MSDEGVYVNRKSIRDYFELDYTEKQFAKGPSLCKKDTVYSGYRLAALRFLTEAAKRELQNQVDLSKLRQDRDNLQARIESLQSRIAEMEAREPVAELCEEVDETGSHEYFECFTHIPIGTKLYT